MDSGPPRAWRPRGQCAEAPWGRMWSQGLLGTAPGWGQAGGQAGLSPELILGDQAGLGEGSGPSSGCHVCRPQVPIIPVVYSSFSSFYNYKTKLFTPGTPKLCTRWPACSQSLRHPRP